MKCEDCLAIIEEYFDGELKGHESAKVADHLIACGTCNEVYESLQQEQKLYAHYQRDVEVTSALWQGVRAGIRQEVTRQETITPAGVAERLRRFFTDTFHAPRFSPALAAMLVVIAIGATVAVMKYMNSGPDIPTVAKDNANVPTPSTNGNENNNSSGTIAEKGNENVNKNTAPEKENGENNTPDKNHYQKIPNQPQLIASNHSTKATKPSQAGAEVKPNATAEDLLRDAEMKYIKAIVLLERDFDKRRSKLDPKLVEKLDGSLASIDRTIAETRKAVRQNPGDPIALQYMLTAYAKKVEVLRDVTTN
jgi:hypothetical protein